MKLFKTLFATAVALMVASSVQAADTVKVEAYAHPTMFGSQVQSTQTTDGYYLVGDKKLQADELLTVQGKENVVIESDANDLLATLKANSKGVFDAKMPILRSEMAVVLADGLKIPASKPRYQYKDVDNSYWAKTWIDKALNEGIMIGYPDRNFRPDQQITKAEVFATLAQLIDVKTDKSLILPKLGEYEMQQIPRWAIAPTKEVMASGILDNAPDQKTLASAKYLSKEQVAYLVVCLKAKYGYNSKFSNAKYQPTLLKVEMTERVDARHANIGDTFYARLTEDAKVAGECFADGSKVKGEVVEVSRPGVKNPGYVKVKFVSIQNGDLKVDFPSNVSNVNVTEEHTTNVVARLLASPFSATGRVAGVAGRAVSSAANVVSNGTERLGDNLSNTMANTASLEPVAGLRSFGKGFITLGTGVYDVAKLAVSGTFGMLYEFGDEVRYLILPSSCQDSALNPGDELTIMY